MPIFQKKQRFFGWNSCVLCSFRLPLHCHWCGHGLMDLVFWRSIILDVGIFTGYRGVWVLLTNFGLISAVLKNVRFGEKKTLFIQQSDFPAIFYVCPAILDGRNLLNLLAELFADRVHHVMASWIKQFQLTKCYGTYKDHRRKFRSQTSDNMDRWKAEQGRGREKRKIWNQIDQLFSLQAWATHVAVTA